MNLNIKVRSLGYKDYRTYLNSSHWKAIRVKFFKSKLVRKNTEGYPICEFCTKDNKLHLHHKTYKDLGREKLNQLNLVCEDCHSLIHHLAKKYTLGLWKSTTCVGRMKLKLASDVQIEKRFLKESLKINS